MKLSIEKNSICSHENHRLSIGLKVVILCLSFYFFVIGFDFFSYGVQLIIGRLFCSIYRLNMIFDNKVAALMIGILMSVFIQSTTTSSSIVSSMVISQAISIRTAIPIIMGTNIGSTITSTLVAFTKIENNYKFQKAFSDAVLHDIFNLLSAIVLLPIEHFTHYVEYASGLLVTPLMKLSKKRMKIETFNKLTRPFVKLIIQFDSRVLEAVARNNYTSDENDNSKYSMASMAKNPLLKRDCGNKYGETECIYLLRLIDSWPEWLIGLILVLFGLIIICVCLIGLKRTINSIFAQETVKSIQEFTNSDFPGYFKYFTGFFFIMIGIFLTIIIQSSSIFTSMLTLLVGIGFLSIERVFPMILGSNIGIGVSGILITLGNSRKTLKYSLQMALCHFLFDVSGAIIWYPIERLRNIPIKMAKSIGAQAAKYHWFAIIYILTFFFFIPSSLFGLSFAGRIIFHATLALILLFVILLFTINKIQKLKPNLLPSFLKTWDFLPKYLRSLEPYDQFFKRMRELTFYNNDDYIIEPSHEYKEALLNKSKLYDISKINRNFENM